MRETLDAVKNRCGIVVPVWYSHSLSDEEVRELFERVRKAYRDGLLKPIRVAHDPPLVALPDTPVTVENQPSALQTNRNALELPDKGPGFDCVPALTEGASSLALFQSNVKKGFATSKFGTKQPVVRKPETVVQKTCRRHGASSSRIRYGIRSIVYLVLHLDYKKIF